MPIYEYECAKCKKRFEYMQKMSEGPKKKCEKCGGKLEKLISSSGFILKGGGWYKDLYSKKPGSSSSSESSSSSSSSSSDSKSEPKSEAKSESKGEAKSESKGEAKSESKKDTGSKKERK